MTATAARERVETPVEKVAASAYNVPTDEPESDGTFEWDSTTIVVVEASAGGRTGLGYTYGHEATAKLVESQLAPLVEGSDPVKTAATWTRMGASLRNIGRPGIGFMAIAAVDTALWDLKARLLDRPLVDLLPGERDAVPIYGSGGFTSYSLPRLREQLAGWVAQGIPRVKIKVGRDPSRDAERLDAARQTVGDATELFADANGAFGRKQALDWAHRYRREWGVAWFEEPVSSADFDGLREVRDHGPPGLDVAAGEYAYVPADFRNLLEARAVDVLQADVTRCGGITGLLRAGGLADAYGIDLSGHCAPQLSAHALCGVPRLRHLEYFHDHVRVEAMLFDGALEPVNGCLCPDRSRPGHGLDLKRADAERYRVG